MVFKIMNMKDRVRGVSPRLDLGDLWSTRPVSRSFGFDRGTPVDRHFVDRFLTAHAGDVFGRTLEIGDDSYTAQYGHAP
jgi:hypothetical protein